jgi:hypothetical protein
LSALPVAELMERSGLDEESISASEAQLRDRPTTTKKKKPRGQRGAPRCSPLRTRRPDDHYVEEGSRPVSDIVMEALALRGAQRSIIERIFSSRSSKAITALAESGPDHAHRLQDPDHV